MIKPLLLAMLFAMLLAVTAVQAADKAPLRYVVKTDGLLSTDPQQPSGFQQKMGAALAHQLGRPVRYVLLPRTRIMAALEGGGGDLLCSYLPTWMPGDVDWTRAFIPVSEVLLTMPRVTPPASLADLRGKRLGTVLGFRYPTLEQALGKDFIRDDAPNSALSFRKWAAGRFDHLVTTRNVITQHAADGALPPGYHVMPILEVKTMCAVSRKSDITVAEVNAAINALEKNGALTAILKLR
ncbi:transporter substrate-binding domain-containing protein [Duganella sp. FT94W]|uniref:Transporter substrate-binding domain-containing protein n=1 Tax=Duganella lactea TaxID=2692173 RepID=A0ABW9V2D5_9BURK|nr:transporter substrate-binding domain-containing protein [Duganella lactea]MYM33725.1 transporter substrate-binding domain-containing protein [Duganella lactea]